MPGVGEQSTAFLVDMTIYFVMNRNNRLPCPSHTRGSYITTMHVPSQLEFPRYPTIHPIYDCENAPSVIAFCRHPGTYCRTCCSS